MEWLTSQPVWVLALMIFVLRIMDVGLGTVRMLTVVAGRVRISVLLGFIEILIWIFAISSVFASAGDNPVLMLAYAAGFATGNAVGIWVERRLAMGMRVLRIIAASKGHEIAEQFRDEGQIVTTIQGEGRDGPRVLLYMLTERKNIDRWIQLAQEMDPTMFYVVEPVSESRRILGRSTTAAHRSLMKKK